jgi:hypothetical protein
VCCWCGDVFAVDAVEHGEFSPLERSGVIAAQRAELRRLRAQLEVMGAKRKGGKTSNRLADVAQVLSSTEYLSAAVISARCGSSPTTVHRVMAKLEALAEVEHQLRQENERGFLSRVYRRVA